MRAAPRHSTACVATEGAYRAQGRGRESKGRGRESNQSRRPCQTKPHAVTQTPVLLQHLHIALTLLLPRLTSMCSATDPALVLLLGAAGASGAEVLQGSASQTHTAPITFTCRRMQQCAHSAHTQRHPSICSITQPPVCHERQRGEGHCRPKVAKRALPTQSGKQAN